MKNSLQLCDVWKKRKRKEPFRKQPVQFQPDHIKLNWISLSYFKQDRESTQRNNLAGFSLKVLPIKQGYPPAPSLLCALMLHLYSPHTDHLQSVGQHVCKPAAMPVMVN